MQTVVRGESRRRPLTPDPSRRRRSSSVSSVPLTSPLPHLSSFLRSITYFVAAAPTLPIILLALPITFLSTLFLLPFRPSFSAVRVTFRTPHLPVLTALHTSHILTTLLAVRFIGPVRALLTLGAAPTLLHVSSALRESRRPRSLACVLFTLIALSLLAFDVSTDAPAAKVRDRVMQTSAGRAVHARIQHISHHINFNSLPFRHRAHSENPEAVPEVPLSDSLKQLKPHVDPPPPHPDKPPVNNVSAANGIRRRLMAIVKGEQLAAAENGKHSHDERQTIAQKQSESSRRQNDLNPLFNESAKKVAADEPSSQMIATSRISHDFNATDQSVVNESVSRLTASLGVFMGCCASVIGHAAVEMRERVMSDAGDWSAVAVAVFISCSVVFSAMLFVTFLAAITKGAAVLTGLFSNALPRGIVLSLSWLVVPVLMQVYVKGLMSRASGPRISKATASAPVASISSSMLDLHYGDPNVLSAYLTAALTLLLFRLVGVPTSEDNVGAFTYVSGVLLILSSKFASAPVRQPLRRGMTGSSGDMSIHLTKGLMSTMRSFWLTLRTSLALSFKGLKDIVVHARSNKASWQVLNFLILQSTMAVVELVYATITSSSGLFSISADNFFCSTALAIGLISIHISSRKPSDRFSYGYGRVESLCGFTNGIILVYVGILVVLEAFERFNEDAAIAIGRAFSVCLLGLVGNVLGLYFFPPESRRENHNVQGIYLHIWANTFSFARIAISVGVTTTFPKWKSVDMISAGIVGLGMVVSAIPLLIRSGRLLLLMPLLERDKPSTMTKFRLEEISGVSQVSGLRIWNLTPNYLVASVRLKVSRRYEGSDADILSRARAVFTIAGIAQSQCTIQITRLEDDNTESVVFLHKRSRSSLPDTGINVEMLAGISKFKTDAGEERSNPAE